MHCRNFRIPHILQSQIFAAVRKESFYAHYKILKRHFSPNDGHDLLAM